MGQLLPGRPGKDDDEGIGRDGAPSAPDGDMEAMEDSPSPDEKSTKTGDQQKPILPLGKKQLELLPDRQQPGDEAGGDQRRLTTSWLYRLLQSLLLEN